MDSDCYISLHGWIRAGQIILNYIWWKNLNSGNYVTSNKKIGNDIYTQSGTLRPSAVFSPHCNEAHQIYTIYEASTCAEFGFCWDTTAHSNQFAPASTNALNWSM